MPHVPTRPRALLVVALAVVGLVPSVSSANTVPRAPRCPLFRANNIWHSDISSLPVHRSSKDWLASMGGPSVRLHPDFGGPYGIPYKVVGARHQKVTVEFRYDDESDPGPYPFGPDIPIEGGQDSRGDRHAIMLDRSTCTLYELFDARYSDGGSTAGSGAIWDLGSNALRPRGWTSADAAGLPILLGLLRLDEVEAGTVDHAIRVTAALTDQSYLWPARHQAGHADNPLLPPMGARFRLKASFDTSGYLPETRVILAAMKRYGLILADNGSNWFFTGAQDYGWDNDVLDELKTIPAGSFEAVDVSSLMINPDSGRARQT